MGRRTLVNPVGDNRLAKQGQVLWIDLESIAMLAAWRIFTFNCEFPRL